VKFICGLFNDAVIGSDYVASNDRIIDERRTGKDTEEKSWQVPLRHSSREIPQSA
jgi:hypothetical protein